MYEWYFDSMTFLGKIHTQNNFRQGSGMVIKITRKVYMKTYDICYIYFNV